MPFTLIYAERVCVPLEFDSASILIVVSSTFIYAGIAYSVPILGFTFTSVTLVKSPAGTWKRAANAYAPRTVPDDATL